MSRFVVLYHDCPPDDARPSHWDLMFECGDTLRTWALNELPNDWDSIVACTKASGAMCRSAAETNYATAERLADHRRDYLTYEGPVSRGRGNVVRVEEGTFKGLADSPGQWQVHVRGRLLCGIVALARPNPDVHDWQLTYHADSSDA